MPRPETPVDDLMSLLPSAPHLSDVYMPLTRLTAISAVASIAACLSAIIFAYCLYALFADGREGKNLDFRFLFIATISALCTGIMAALAWVILYSGTPITVAA
jgi:hypothetical protein